LIKIDRFRPCQSRPEKGVIFQQIRGKRVAKKDIVFKSLPKQFFVISSVFEVAGGSSFYFFCFDKSNNIQKNTTMHWIFIKICVSLIFPNIEDACGGPSPHPVVFAFRVRPKYQQLQKNTSTIPQKMTQNINKLP